MTIFMTRFLSEELSQLTSNQLQPIIKQIGLKRALFSTVTIGNLSNRTTHTHQTCICKDLFSDYLFSCHIHLLVHQEIVYFAQLCCFNCRSTCFPVMHQLTLTDKFHLTHLFLYFHTWLTFICTCWLASFHQAHLLVQHCSYYV